MTTVVFVHGTGGRRRDGGAAVAALTRGLARRRPDMRVVTCAWGAAGLGVAEPPGGLRCLPDSAPSMRAEPALAARAEGGPVPVPPDRSATAADGVMGRAAAALWALLYADPMAELRLLLPDHGGMDADGRDVEVSADPRDVPFGLTKDALRARMDSVGAPGSPTVAVAADLGIGEVFTDACGSLQGHADLVVDLLTRRPAEQAAGVVAAAARAVVAAGVQRADIRAAEAVPLHGRTRERLVALIALALSGSGAAEEGPVADGAACAGTLPDAGIATEPFTAHLAFGYARAFGALRDRRMWAAPAAGFPGDVLRYLGNGAAIRAHVRACAVRAEPPVVLLGHSLGSVACVDVLAGPDPPRVDLLVTVGSPVPLAYELDVLPVLRRGAPLPGGFPRWLNAYDPADTWSYPAAATFGADRVRDIDVRSGEPDGRAHASYWVQPAFLDALAEAAPRG